MALENLGVLVLAHQIIKRNVDAAQASHFAHGRNPVQVHGRLLHRFQVRLQVLQPGHLGRDDVPAPQPAAESRLQVRVVGRVVVEQGFQVPADVQPRDGGEAGGDDGLGEGDKGAEPVDVKSVDGVQDFACFAVDLAAGLEQGDIGVRDGAQAAG